MRVQSPARNKFAIGDRSAPGRQRSTPGSGENVAVTSLITVAFQQLRFARRRQHVRQFAAAQLDDFLPRARHQIVGSADHQLQILPVFAAASRPRGCSFRWTRRRAIRFIRSTSSVLLNIHCVVWSSSVRNGSVITVRSNQKCTPVIGDVLQVPQALERRVPVRAISAAVRVEQHVVRHRRDARIGRNLRAILEHQRREAVSSHAKFANSAAQPHFPAALRNRLAAALVQIGERHRGIPTRYPGVRQKRLPENFDSIARVRARQFFIERAHQHHAPESLDRSGRLLHPMQPIEHRDAIAARRMSRLRARSPACAFAMRTLVRQRQRAETARTTAPCAAAAAAAMPRLSNACPVAIDEIQPVVKPDLVARSHAPVKIREVRAAARASRAGNCPLRCRRAACRKWRARPGGDASRAGARESRLQPARRRRTAPPGRRRSPARFARASLLPPTAVTPRGLLQEILNFFRARQRNARREHVEVALFDPRQQSCCTCARAPRSVARLSHRLDRTSGAPSS